MKNVRKFVSWDVPCLDTLSDSKAYKCMQKLNSGMSLTRQEKDSFSFIYGCYEKLQGWLFDYTPYCRRYLVHYKNGGWYEIWHFDKTAIRKNFAGITEIVEIQKRSV